METLYPINGLKRSLKVVAAIGLLTAWQVIADTPGPVVVPLSSFSIFGPEIDPQPSTGLASEQLAAPADGRLGGFAAEAPPPAGRLFEHREMQSDLEYIQGLAPVRQRVAVRAVDQRGLPVVYPAYHWLPRGIVSATREAVAERGGRNLIQILDQSGACFFCEDHSLFDLIHMLGLLNVRVYRDATERDVVPCCPPHAELAVDLAIGKDDGRLVRFAMEEVDHGIYYVAAPVDAAHRVLEAVIEIGERPLMSIVALEGVQYAPLAGGIAYAVRWGDFVLEYGAHYKGDAMGVI